MISKFIVIIRNIVYFILSLLEDTSFYEDDRYKNLQDTDKEKIKFFLSSNICLNFSDALNHLYYNKIRTIRKMQLRIEREEREERNKQEKIKKNADIICLDTDSDDDCDFDLNDKINQPLIFSIKSMNISQKSTSCTSVQN